MNGLRACLKKGFEDTVHALDADFFCVQETKMQPGQAEFAPEGYTEYLNSAEKKGYSGTAIWAKQPALSVRYGIGHDIHSHEGRAITLEYPDFFLVNLYVPNAQNELARIDYRMQWEDDLREYLHTLDGQKPVILCGDLNDADIAAHGKAVAAASDRLSVEPQMVESADTQMKVKQADGVVLLVHLWKTKRTDLEQELRICQKLGGNVLGVAVIG